MIGQPERLKTPGERSHSDGPGRGPSERGKGPPLFAMLPVPWTRKVTTRFFLWLFLALSAGFSALAYQIDRQEGQEALRALDRRLSSEAGVLMASLVRLLEKDDLPGAQALFRTIRSTTLDEAILLGTDGQSVLLSSGPELPVSVSRLLSDRPGRGFMEGRSASGRRVFWCGFP